MGADCSNCRCTNKDDEKILIFDNVDKIKSRTDIRKERLQEATQTGAERLVTVCHYCNQTFAADEVHYDFSVTNYVNLVAEAMGIRREDKFKKYTRWGNLERILKDVDDHIAESPFDSERIIEVLQAVLVNS